MNYYERHIGDYLKDTAHLSLLEHGVYTRLMDVYYTREGAIPAKEAARLIGARSKDEREALQLVLAEFFVLVDGVHRQERCEREIERYQGKTPDREAKRENDRERQRRARERRKELFEALRSHGVVPAFDTTTAELEALLSQHPKRDGHAHVTQPVTRDNTATHSPDTRHQYSVAEATGGKPPARGLSPQDRVWAFGVPMLTAAGVKEANARSMLGGLCKRHGAEAVADVLDRAAHEQPIEPVAWLQAALKSKPTREGSGKPSTGKVDIFAGLEQ